MDIKKIGILYICTGKYSVFWKDFYLSMEKNFITEAEKHYFVFTDNPQIDFENENPKIHRIYQENLGWPNNTLMRFHIFLEHEKEFLNMDYIFFFNANLLVLEKITEEEFLPTFPNTLVATLHPGFYNKKRRKFTYEDNKKSTAYINSAQGEHYFAGGLNGGKTNDFIQAMKIMRDDIDIDKKNGVIATWHDESHWNKYLIGRTDVKILSPSYLYPEGWTLPLKSTILVRDKNKYGGHALLRNENNNKFYEKYLNLGKFFFNKRGPVFSNLDKYNLKKSKFIVVTIAFNNSEIIKIQHSYIKQNLKEEFVYVVVDNSNLKNISLEISKYCLKNDIPYVKLPANPFSGNPSKSHGIALNWAYAQIIKRFEPIFFGFLDHDIVPFKENQITPLIKNELFGLIQERKEKWYLWPGFSFYKYDFVEKYKLNFMPCFGLDTGGSNYDILYKRINKDNILKVRQIYFDFDKKEKIVQFNDSDRTVEIIGDWVHIMRTSNWNNKNEEKNSYLSEIIDAVKKYNFD